MANDASAWLDENASITLDLSSLAFSYPVEVKPIKEIRRDKLLQIIDAIGGQTVLANRLGKDRNQVYQWALDPSNPAHRGISDRTARAIEVACGLHYGEMDHIGSMELTSHPVSHYDEIRPHTAVREVPVRGTASMGMDGYWVDLEYPAGHGDGYFEHPTSDPDAYVLRVKGDSMHPAIRSGWYVLVEPNGDIQQGEYVLVKLADGRSTVKELLWHKHGEYALLAIANDARLTVAEADIEGIYPIAAVLPPSKRKL